MKGGTWWLISWVILHHFCTQCDDGNRHLYCYIYIYTHTHIYIYVITNRWSHKFKFLHSKYVLGKLRLKSRWLRPGSFPCSWLTRWYKICFQIHEKTILMSRVGFCLIDKPSEIAIYKGSSEDFIVSFFWNKKREIMSFKRCVGTELTITTLSFPFFWWLFRNPWVSCIDRKCSWPSENCNRKKCTPAIYRLQL